MGKRRRGNALARLYASKEVSPSKRESRRTSEPTDASVAPATSALAAALDAEQELRDNYASVVARFSASHETLQEGAEKYEAATTMADSQSLQEEGQQLVLVDTPSDLPPDTDPIEIARPAGKRKRRRIGLAELKAQAPRPDLVDWFDADAPDPLFLVKLRCKPGTVPVPANWRQRSENIVFKARGSRPYRLSPSIAATGIAMMRDISNDAVDDFGAKARQRDRVQPRMGKLDIDFRKMHAAFYGPTARPPRLLPFGHIWPADTPNIPLNSQFRPGHLSERLRKALGIGPDDAPPWVKTMARKPSPIYKGTEPAKRGERWGAMVLDEEDASEEPLGESPTATDILASHDANAYVPSLPDAPKISQGSEIPSEPVREEELVPVEQNSDDDDEIPPVGSSSERQLYRELPMSKAEGALGTTHKYNLV